jgi:SAM-dependent methyltransferase
VTNNLTMCSILSPRFVTHIDDGAIGAITEYYAATMHEGADVLDLCSSWISHLPPDLKLGRVAGIGMNDEELKRNERLTEYEVRDLNVDPKLPYEDDSFDFVCNVVSVDYLTKPLEVFSEMHRVLRPGGRAIMSFSNRCFPTKAIGIWTQTDDAGHLWIVGSYYHFAPGGAWSDVRCTRHLAQATSRGPDVRRGGEKVRTLWKQPRTQQLWLKPRAHVCTAEQRDDSLCSTRYGMHYHHGHGLS